MTKFVCLKDLAQTMGMCPRSVKRWWKRLGVPPTVQGHASHRWSAEDAERLIKAWRNYWEKHQQHTH